MFRCVFGIQLYCSTIDIIMFMSCQHVCPEFLSLTNRQQYSLAKAYSQRILKDLLFYFFFFFFFLIKSTFAIKHRIVNGDHVLIPLNRSPSLVKFPSCLSLDFGLILYLSVQGTWPTHRMPSALQHQPILHIPDSHGMDLRSLH